MPLTWTEDLAVGFGRIDEQHRELFTRYNALFMACTDGTGREMIAPLLDFLIDYVKEHFAEEESFMFLYDYPDCDQHIQEHRELFEHISDLRRDLAENGPSARMVVILTHSLVHWLVSHVKQTDMKLGHFLQERAAEPPR